MTAPMAAGRASGAPLVAHDFEPTIFEFSSPGRMAASFRTTDLPEWTEEELVPQPRFAETSPWRCRRSPSATSWRTSPGSPTASTRSTSAPTRSARAR